MKVRTLIADDEPLARARLRQLLATHEEIQIVAECGDGREAVREICARRPELVFLDVQMPELDGFGVLGELARVAEGTPPVIVFVTAHDRFALRAFDVHAVDYLLKPFDRDRLQTACRQALTQLTIRDLQAERRQHEALAASASAEGSSLERLAVKSNGATLWLELSEIDWIQSADNYVALHVGAKSHLLRETLNTLEKRLPSDKFVRISRSTMVNPGRVRSMRRRLHGGYELTLTNGAYLTMSRRYRDRVSALALD